MKGTTKAVKTTKKPNGLLASFQSLTGVAPTATPKVEAAPKLSKAAKAPKAPKPPKDEKDEEAADRLPTTIEELKETKSGLVAWMHVAGKEKDEIAKAVKDTFKVSEAQAVKIVRRITGRARFFRRVFDLMAAK
jgi:hypothetical protein